MVKNKTAKKTNLSVTNFGLFGTKIAIKKITNT